MAEPLSLSVPIDKSTREPWTEGGAEPTLLPHYLHSTHYFKMLLLVYEYSPPGLLLGLIPLIVLTLRCNPFGDDDISHSPRDRVEEEGYDDEGPASNDLDPFRPFCLGDVGQLDD